MGPRTGLLAGLFTVVSLTFGGSFGGRVVAPSEASAVTELPGAADAPETVTASARADAWTASHIAALSSADCRGIASHDPSWCESADCRGVAARDATWCDSADCRGVAARDPSSCTSSLCRAWASGDRTWCETGDCKGVASGDRTWCESAPCKAIASSDPSWCP